MSSELRSSAELANRMLRPSVLDEGLRSGLFLVRTPDTHRWRAFSEALVSELQRLGAVVIWTDLMEPGAGSAAALYDELHGLLSAVREQFLPSQAKGQFVSSAATLSHVIKSIVDLSCSDTVLILDHASRLRDQIGENVLKALKAARDAVNGRPDPSGRFFLVAVDDDLRVLHEFTSDPAQAFFGANVLELTDS